MPNLNNLLDYVKSLSLSDYKSLMGKTLKAGEELGELASEILPYEHAFATTHRFPNKEKILEEACDLMLCALSVPFSMGFTTEDIAEMMKTKADKWAGLQVVGNLGKFPLPFEIHVTVNTNETGLFVDACKLLNVKPIVLDLQKVGMTDVMTSSVIVTDNLGAYTEMKRISQGLSKAGFVVVREKIETVPWHPAAPSKEHGTGEKAQGYFECHFNVKVPSEERARELANLAKALDLYLSRNKFKITDTYYNQMLTLREYDSTREDFDKRVAEIKYMLLGSGFELEKVIVEYAIYDSSKAHDLKWLKAD